MKYSAFYSCRHRTKQTCLQIYLAAAARAHYLHACIVVLGLLLAGIHNLGNAPG